MYRRASPNVVFRRRACSTLSYSHLFRAAPEPRDVAYRPPLVRHCQSCPKSPSDVESVVSVTSPTFYRWVRNDTKLVRSPSDESIAPHVRKRVEIRSPSFAARRVHLLFLPSQSRGYVTHCVAWLVGLCLCAGHDCLRIQTASVGLDCRMSPRSAPDGQSPRPAGCRIPSP